MVKKTTRKKIVKNTRKVNWLMTLLFSVCLGVLGVDRFIMGQIGLGILKLITVGGFGVWWLVDVLLIASKYPFKNIEWVDTTLDHVPVKSKVIISGSTRQVNWILVLLLSIIFGTFGVDRFVLGHVWLGLLKLVTFGGMGIWWLVDIILIACKYPFKDIEWIS